MSISHTPLPIHQHILRGPPLKQIWNSTLLHWDHHRPSETFPPCQAASDLAHDPPSVYSPQGSQCNVKNGTAALPETPPATPTSLNTRQSPPRALICPVLLPYSVLVCYRPHCSTFGSSLKCPLLGETCSPPYFLRPRLLPTQRTTTCFLPTACPPSVPWEFLDPRHLEWCLTVLEAMECS